jgi:hypothetical protein
MTEPVGMECCAWYGRDIGEEPMSVLHIMSTYELLITVTMHIECNVSI